MKRVFVPCSSCDIADGQIEVPGEHRLAHVGARVGVSKRVTSPRNDDEGLLDEIDLAAAL